MSQALINGRVLTPVGLREGLAVVLRGGRIDTVIDAGDLDPALDRHDLEGGVLAPGFIDTQVNGGGGVMFNNSPTVEGVAAIARAHRRFGSTGLLLTLISDDLSVVDQALRAVEQAISQGVPGVLGIHVEGPFLNAARKGIHDPGKFRPLDEDALALLTSLKHGSTLVTLAPETTTPEMISRLARSGVIVAAGHTDASYGTTKDALAAGVTGFTHLFNAMSPLASRAPGVVGAALENQDAWCGMIVDGVHVSPVVLRLALKCRPVDRFMLVSDAMPCVGLSDETFMLQGREIRVEDGICRATDGTLAGSNLDMATAVRNAVTLLGLPLDEALALASSSPARFLGLVDRGAIAAGMAADLVLLDDDLIVRRTWIAGNAQAA